MADSLCELRNLAYAQPDDSEILLVLASGLINTTNYYGNHGESQAMASALDELRHLALAHPNESEIQLQLAQGLFNATN